MRRRQHQQAVVILVLVTLICEVSSQPSQCCPSISVTSTSVGEEYQAVQLGVYTIKDNLTVNGRPVYKQIRGDQYFYYWVRNRHLHLFTMVFYKYLLYRQVFSEDRHDDGENWLVRDDYDNWRHGIESPNLQPTGRAGGQRVRGERPLRGRDLRQPVCERGQQGGRPLQRVDSPAQELGLREGHHSQVEIDLSTVTDPPLRVQCYDRDRAARCSSSVRLR